MYVLRHLSRLEDVPEPLRGKIFERLFKASEIAKYTPEEREAYQESLKHQWDLHNSISTAKREAKNEGIREGIKKGKEEGIREEKLALAKKLLAKVMALEDVAELTGLSLEEIENLG